jgi:hypothetical protein
MDRNLPLQWKKRLLGMIRPQRYCSPAILSACNRPTLAVTRPFELRGMVGINLGESTNPNARFSVYPHFFKSAIAENPLCWACLTRLFDLYMGADAAATLAYWNKTISIVFPPVRGAVSQTGGSLLRCTSAIRDGNGAEIQFVDSWTVHTP